MLFHPKVSALQIIDPILEINSTVFVKLDVYPIDGIGNRQEKALRLLRRVSKKKLLLYLNQTTYKNSNPIKQLLLWGIRRIPSRWLLTNIDRTMQIHSTKKNIYFTRWREGTAVPNLFEREVFGTPVLLQFESSQFMAPAGYAEYLTKVYGDYMVEHRENAGMRHDINNNDVAKRFAKQMQCSNE